MIDKAEGSSKKIPSPGVNELPEVQEAPQEKTVNVPKIVKALTEEMQSVVDYFSAFSSSPEVKKRFQEAVKEGRIPKEQADKRTKSAKTRVSDFLAQINFGVRDAYEERGTDFRTNA